LPALERAAKRLAADLYIAHNLGALPAAVAAAEKHQAHVGFDAEDLHSGERGFGSRGSPIDELTVMVEQRYLPYCDYVTAAAPGIAEAYTAKYGIPTPVTILNVFPLWQRLREFRLSKDNGPLTLYWFSQTIGPYRGLEDVVQAMGILRGCAIELHMCGVWQHGYRDHLSQFAKSVGMEPEQIVVHPPIPPDEMVRHAAEYDVGLALEQPYCENRNLCLTNKIFTYLLAGNAVIATATKGQQPIVESIGYAGFCYEPGDANALAGHLKLWYEDRASLQTARQEAWDWGTKKYNWDLEKKKFLQVVETTLKSGRS
jgi:glycosyltransferase involved in cell wall biosynthesis